MSLPSPPAGTENVYAYYLSELDDMVCQRPTAGFEARIAVLLSLYAGALAVILPICVLTKMIARRKGERAFWVYRIVEGYISLNFMLVAEVCSLICPAILAAYTYTQYEVFQHQRNLKYFRPFRFFYLIPLVIAGYLVTSASFQAYLVVASRRGSQARLPTPRVANIFFVAVLAIFLITLFVLGGVATAKWWPVEAAYQDARRTLVAAHANSAATITDEVMQDIGRQYGHLVQVAKELMPYQQATILLATVYATFNMLLNAGAISLVLIIRRQIKFHDMTASSGPTYALQYPQFTRQPPTRERSRQVRELKRVSYDQITFSALIVFLCAAWIPQTLYMAIGGIGIGLSWIRLEFSYFLIPWAFGLTQGPAAIFILYSHIQAYRQLCEESRTIHGLGLSGSAPISSGVQISTMVETQIDVASSRVADEKV